MMDDPDGLDARCEFAIGFLLNGRGDARQLTAKLAQIAPDRLASELVLVLSSAAASIEDIFASPESRATVLDTWRIAALLGVDLHVMQMLDLPHATCADLMRYWQTEDGFFLG